MKLAFLDVETTGTDPKRHGLIEVAGYVESMYGVDDFALHCRPYADKLIEPKALEVNGRTDKEIKTWSSPKDQHAALVKILERHVDRYDKSDKLHFVGYNAMFDYDFIREWFSDAGDKYFGSWFWWPPIDVAVMAATKFMDERDTKRRFRLVDVAGYLELPVSKEGLHEAAVDAELTRLLFYRLTEDKATNE